MNRHCSAPPTHAGIQALGLTLALLALSLTATALTATDVTLYAPLDGAATAMHAARAAEPASVGDLAWAPGVRGQAFLFRDADGYIDYATADVLNPEAGAMSVWVCPLEWGGADTHIRHFVTFPAGGGDKGWFCWLYKFFAGSCYFLVWEPDYNRPVLVSARCDWPQGQWVHFVATWNGCRMRLFRNGEDCGITRNLRRSLLPSVGSALRLGGRSDPDKRATLLDELYVFSRELTASEAQALYDMDKPGGARPHTARASLELPTPAASTLLDLRARQYAGTKTLVAGLDVFALRGPERRAHTIELTVKDQDNKPIIRQTAQPERPYTEHPFPVASLPPGDYVLTAALKTGDRAVEQATSPFTVKAQPEWLGNSLGVTDDVVEPWTPVDVRGSAARCWGREVTWADRLLPVQISSQQLDLLSAPMRIVGSVSGEQVALADEQLQVTGQDRTMVRLAGKARLHELSLSLDARMEYDGMLWMTLTVRPRAGNQRIDRLAIQIPMRSAAATLMITGRGTSPNTGKIQPVKTRMNGQVAIWLGNEKAGLSWFCPEYRDWHCPAPDPRVEIEPGDDGVLVTLNLISRPVDLEGERRFSFGFMPTPVRPKAPGWRSWGFGSQPSDAPIDIYTEGWAMGHGSPIPGERFQRHYLKQIEQGKRLFYYVTLSSNSPVTPAYGLFGDEWATSPLGNRPYAPGGDSRAHTGVCPGAPSLSDWMLWAFKANISDAGLPVTGLYVDVTSTAHCSNSYHGCGYDDTAGNRIATLPILGVRRWQKRLYTYLRQQHPGAILMNHESARIHLYHLGFCDTMVDGENLTMLLQSKSYPELLPLDTWRAEYMGHPFGFIAVFLPEFTRSFAGDQKRKAEYMGEERIPEVEYIAGMCITHDNLVWPAYSNPRPYRALEAAKKTFGWDDKVEFLPYWDNAQYVNLPDNPDPEHVVCSLYRRNGALLAALMNATDAAVNVKLKLSHDTLGTNTLASEPWLDAYLLNTFEYPDYRQSHPRPMLTVEGKRVELPQADGLTPVTVQPHNFRLLLLAP